jgi:acyl-CoA synthetase (AMP-forming)/AMP-acid ligase II
MEGNRGEPALVYRGESFSYGALLDRARDWEAELERRGIGSGTVVVLEGNFSLGAVSLLLALLKLGAIAVPLTPLSRTQRDRFSAIAEATWTFVFDEEDGFAATPHEREVTAPLLRKLIDRKSPGLVIFSSGSTGEPKAILHDFAALLEKFRRAGQKKSLLTFLLFDHIGGLDTLFNALSSGGTLVTTPNRDPDIVCRAIAAHRVHTLPTSPTFLNLLLISEAWRHHDLSSLQVIAYGTEPMPESVLQRLAEAFPGVKLVQTYGTSELGVLRTRAKDGKSLWIKFTGEGFETKIVDGVLWVRTPAAMMGYLNAPDLFDPEGWMNTQDAVEVEGDYLRILGRVTDLINVGGQKVYPAEVEDVILEMENVRDAAVFGERSPLTGQFVAVRVNLVTPEPLDAFKRRLRAFCRDRLPSYKIPARIEITEADQFSARSKKMRRAGSASEGGQS